MSISRYFERKKEIQEKLLLFLESEGEEEEEGNNEKIYADFIKYFKEPQYKNYIGNHKDTFILINKIASNYHRSDNFFKKIEKILLDIQDTLKQTLSNIDIYLVFKNNKRILLYLIQNNILVINPALVEKMLHIRQMSKHKINRNIIEYLYPEIHSFLPKPFQKTVKGQIFYLDSINVRDADYLSKFEEKRSKNENSNYICEVIRSDSVEEFVQYVSQSNIDLKSSVKRSVFETNSFLNNRKNPTLIEYAAFFGSIDIFNYLRMNNVEVEPSLLRYAIHSNNAEMIHIIEDCLRKYEDKYKVYQPVFEECLKCHNFRLTDYFVENFIHNASKILSVKYMNFEYLRKIDKNFFLNDEVLHYLCKNDCFEVMKCIAEMRCNIKWGTCRDIFRAAFSRSNTDIVQLMYKYYQMFDYKYIEKECDYQEEMKAHTYGYEKNQQRTLHKLDLQRADFAKIVHIPSEFNKISPNLFQKIPLLEQVTFSENSVYTFRKGLFYGCPHLKVVNVPPSVIKIDNFAFGNCVELTEVGFVNTSKLVEVGKFVFTHCSSLKSISFPPKLGKIGEKIFNDCGSLEEVVVPSAAQKDATSENFGCSEQVKITFYDGY